MKINLDETAERRLMRAVNAKDWDFLAGLLREVCSTGVQGGRPDEGWINFVLSAVRGSEPVDQMDAMLSMQMIAVHRAAMKLAGRLANHEEKRLFAKLVQTYAAQMDTRKRYRSDDRAVSVQQNVVPISMLRKLQSEKK